jgi:hypothetical protein
VFITNGFYEVSDLTPGQEFTIEGHVGDQEMAWPGAERGFNITIVPKTVRFQPGPEGIQKIALDLRTARTPTR